jgi:hypothetical protein
MRWRRQERIQACREAVAAFYELRNAIRLMGRADEGSRERAEAVRGALRAGARWQGAAGMVWLCMPKRTAGSIVDLNNELYSVFAEVRKRQAVSRVEDERPEWATAFGFFKSFMEAARHDLSFGVFTSSLNWPEYEEPTYGGH